MPSQTTSIRLDSEKLARLDRLAAAIDRSRSWVMNQAIEQYLDYEEWFAQSVREGIASADRGELTPHDEVMAEARRRISKAGRGGE